MKLMIALGSAAVLTAACTSSASIPGSVVVKHAPSLQLNGGANAGSSTSDTGTRPNPPVRKLPAPPVVPPVVSHPAQPAPVKLRDRCMNETGRPGKPQPMCVPA